MKFKKYSLHSSNNNKINNFDNDKIHIKDWSKHKSNDIISDTTDSNTTHNVTTEIKLDIKKEAKVEEIVSNDITEGTHNIDADAISKLKDKYDKHNPSADSMYHLVEVKVDTDDYEVLKFIKFCVKKRIFDDDYYDYNNGFSIIATKLPKSFKIISDNKNSINKKSFIKYFEKINYKGKIDYIYDTFEKNKNNEITWIEYKSFFLPYVKNIVI